MQQNENEANASSKNPGDKAILTLHCVPQSNVLSEVRIVGVQDFKQSLYQTAARDCVALPSK